MRKVGRHVVLPGGDAVACAQPAPVPSWRISRLLGNGRLLENNGMTYHGVPLAAWGASWGIMLRRGRISEKRALLSCSACFSHPQLINRDHAANVYHGLEAASDAATVSVVDSAHVGQIRLHRPGTNGKTSLSRPSHHLTADL